ncbi:DUF3108 domain-containing protein [Nioella nitratireducens]|uniref:DUF3108 domain-containing protein n=1 Tax=Nioella nitratireducens TaxID=1287720 RepID=UPI0008FD0937|nr:DUF3108 domain-containing protein [Nioella nitratireducens]
MRRLILFLLLLPHAALAQDIFTARYDVRFGPLRIAEIVLRASDTQSAYAVAGRVTSAGIAGAFRDIRFDLAAEGRRIGVAFLPLSYREDVDTGRRASRVSLVYPDGGPVLQSIIPAHAPQPWDVDPAAQGDTIDPMSALYRLARPRPLEALCDWSVAVFDGRRRSSLSVGPVEVESGRALCLGVYARIAGFPPEDMAERRDFPFVVEFSAEEDGRWRLTRVETQTLYGRVRILERD